MSRNTAVPADILNAIDALIVAAGDDDRARMSVEEMKKLLCEKYGIKKYCTGTVVA